MEHQMPVLEQVNIVTGNFARSRDFYSRLGVKFPSLGDDPAGDHFHANGETSNRLRLELDSAAFARVWNQGWSANPDLQGRIVLGFNVVTRDEVDRLYAELTGGRLRRACTAV